MECGVNVLSRTCSKMWIYKIQIISSILIEFNLTDLIRFLLLVLELRWNLSTKVMLWAIRKIYFPFRKWFFAALYISRRFFPLICSLKFFLKIKNCWGGINFNLSCHKQWRIEMRVIWVVTLNFCPFLFLVISTNWVN